MKEYILNSRKKIVVKYVSGTDYYDGYYEYQLHIKCWYKCFNRIKSIWVNVYSMNIMSSYDFEYHKEKILENYKYNQDKKRKFTRLTLFK